MGRKRGDKADGWRARHVSVSVDHRGGFGVHDAGTLVVKAPSEGEPPTWWLRRVRAWADRTVGRSGGGIHILSRSWVQPLPGGRGQYRVKLSDTWLTMRREDYRRRARRRTGRRLPDLCGVANRTKIDRQLQHPRG